MPRSSALRPLFVAALALLAVGMTEPIEAQILLSEPAKMAQTIDGTEILIEYYRPRVRGRAPLFGQESVVWERIWTPGANWGTKFTASKPVTVNGVEIPAGTWTVWMQMSDEEFVPETLVFDPEETIFHTQGPEEREGQIRMPISLQDADRHTEILTWQFEEISSTGGTLTMRWGTHMAEMEIGVEPSMRVTATAEEALPVVGMYSLEPSPAMMPPGTDLSEMPEMTMELTWSEDDGWLRADMEGSPDPFMNTVDLRLMPFAEGVFMPTECWPGDLLNAWEAFVEMDYDADGTVTGFLIRDGVTDEVVMEAKKIN
jgi:hypothetical protein